MQISSKESRIRNFCQSEEQIQKIAQLTTEFVNLSTEINRVASLLPEPVKAFVIQGLVEKTLLKKNLLSRDELIAMAVFSLMESGSD